MFTEFCIITPDNPFVINQEDSPRPFMAPEVEQQAVLNVILSLRESAHLITELVKPVTNTSEFDIFSDPSVVELPIDGKILCSPRGMAYAPNSEGRLGDISEAETLETHASPTLQSGNDFDVLAITQRLKQGSIEVFGFSGFCALTAILSAKGDLMQLSKDELNDLKLRFGAY